MSTPLFCICIFWFYIFVFSFRGRDELQYNLNLSTTLTCEVLLWGILWSWGWFDANCILLSSYICIYEPLTKLFLFICYLKKRSQINLKKGISYQYLYTALLCSFEWTRERSCADSMAGLLGCLWNGAWCKRMCLGACSACDLRLAWRVLAVPSILFQCSKVTAGLSQASRFDVLSDTVISLLPSLSGPPRQRQAKKRES